jgi:hypothetical protein
MSDDSILATGMVRVDPADCQELLRLCTVMGWALRLPLDVMRDESAKRWFLRGPKGKQDYWIRDSDITTLRQTPMWAAVATAKPYGSVAATLAEMVEKPSSATEIELRQRMGQERLQALASHLDSETMKALLEGSPLPAKPLDPVERERAEAAKARLEAEEKLRRIDAWEE